jgi:hypothetical protein
MSTEVTSDVATAVATTASKMSEMRLQDSLGAVLLIMGAIAVVPSALGVAQYTTRPDRDNKKDRGIYVVQSIILALAVIAVLTGALVLGVRYKARAAAGR